MKTKINCPSCGAEIEIEEVLANSIKKELNEEYRKKYFTALEKQKKKILAERDEFYAKEIDKLKRVLEEKEEAIKKLNQREKELDEREKLFIEKEKKREQEIELELKRRQEIFEANIRKAIESNFTIQIEALNKQLSEKDKAIKEFIEKEMELREKQKQLEQQANQIKLEYARKFDEEIELYKQNLSKQFDTEFSLKLAEKDKLIEDMNKQISELKRKAEIGSQQAQGEIQELVLEDTLKANFPMDIIEPVPKGFTGADVIQSVYTNNGIFAGKIIWESKRTKEWKKEWLDKLKDDQIASQSDIAIIVTQALPKEIRDFGVLENVWITNFQSAISLAKALRWALIDIQMIKNSLSGKNEKMELLYNYLISPNFHQKMKSIIDTFKKMQETLEREKRAMEKLWGEREKQIERIFKNLSYMYGELTELTSNALPKIDEIELLPESSENEDIF